MARSKQTALSLEDKASNLDEQDELPTLERQPLPMRLAYVRDLVRALSPLVAEGELGLLRHLLAMAAEEAELQRNGFENGASELRGVAAD